MRKNKGGTKKQGNENGVINQNPRGGGMEIPSCSQKTARALCHFQFRQVKSMGPFFENHRHVIHRPPAADMNMEKRHTELSSGRVSLHLLDFDFRSPFPRVLARTAAARTAAA
mmetsp:Transcript_71135/g.160962  ORF Transcript_71135/g.160962 Transcript_71135/m.160962 type:complete len:113 (-) Transcript_71135:145-483(-)